MAPPTGTQRPWLGNLEATVTVGTMENVITEDAEPIEQATPKMLIEGMDPAELIMTKNVRPVELDAEFIASIQENGLFQPIIATPFEGKYAIILGNRRAAGSIKAGQTVDVIVRSDLSEDAARIVAQLIENMHRQEMRPSEVAAACAQLAIDLGLSEEQIAKKLGKDRKDVRASIALHEMPKAARDAADAGQMDIETAMGLAAFESDPKAYKRLMKATEEGKLAYALKEEGRKRERVAEKAERTAQLLKAGIQIIPKPGNMGYGSRELGIYSLLTKEGGHLTVEEHASCPGHACYFESSTYNGPTEHYVCRDPKRYGHEHTGYYSYKSPEEIATEAARKEEAVRAQAEREEALAIAQELRTEFVQQLCRSKKLPKGVMRFALETLFAHGYDTTGKNVAAVLSYLGVSEPGEEPVTMFASKVGRFAEARQPLVALALAAAMAEENIRTLALPWKRGDNAFALSWFEFLTSHGYELADPEIEFVAELRQQEADEEKEAELSDFEDDEDDEGQEDEEQGTTVSAVADTDEHQDAEETDGTAVVIALAAEDDDHEGDEATEAEPSAEEVAWEELYPEVDEPMAA